jgi:hypothetical protein
VEKDLDIADLRLQNADCTFIFSIHVLRS